MRRVIINSNSLAAGALALAILPTGCSDEAAAAATDEAEAETQIEVPATPSESTYDPRVSLAPLIKRVGPAVVSIHASGRRFGAHAGGSGFILDAKGTVLTNNHVVSNAKELEVHLPDGRKFEANLVGSDAHTDLAVLQLKDVDDLPTVELGGSGELEVGDWVVAIGSPMGLEHSASVGILSGRGRGSLGLYEDSYIDFLQTDADIAPGSSGGPLFDLHGRVVGITTAVGAGSRPGFAIPIDQVKKIVPKIRKDGKVTRGWLGAGSDPTAGDDGARIGQVYRGTPAHEAGLHRGDIVRTVDGKEVANFDVLRHAIADLEPGHTVLLEVERDQKTVELTAVLGERPDRENLELEPIEPTEHRGASSSAPPVRLGVQARETSRGLEVVRVEPGSLADDLDLQPGDVVTTLNGDAIETPADVAAALERSRDRVELELQRDGVKHKVTLERS